MTRPNTKETKKGTRDVDLKPGIYEIAWKDGAFSMLVDASSAGNIKPVQIIESMLADFGENLQENALLVTREDTFANIGSAEVMKLVPLNQVP